MAHQVRSADKQQRIPDLPLTLHCGGGHRNKGRRETQFFQAHRQPLTECCDAESDIVQALNGIRNGRCKQCRDFYGEEGEELKELAELCHKEGVGREPDYDDEVLGALREEYDAAAARVEAHRGAADSLRPPYAPISAHRRRSLPCAPPPAEGGNIDG